MIINNNKPQYQRWYWGKTQLCPAKTKVNKTHSSNHSPPCTKMCSSLPEFVVRVLCCEVLCNEGRALGYVLARWLQPPVLPLLC
ncbi:UNVERIFIED_CONTAM: hypothetical protein FKN15_025634 [Acipenser sinensis]